MNQRLHAKLRDLFLTKTAEEWETIGNRAGAAIGWARSADEWIDAEHARVTKTVVQVEDPEFGPTWMAGLPVRLTATPGEVRAAASPAQRRPRCDHPRARRPVREDGRLRARSRTSSTRCRA